MKRFVSPGEVARQEKILKVAQIDPLNVEVIAPVSMFGSVKMETDDLVGQTYKGRIKVIDWVVDAASGTFGVCVELANPPYRIPAELKCKAHLQK